MMFSLKPKFGRTRKAMPSEKHLPRHPLRVSSSQKEIIIDYLDNGPGLSADIDKPEKIFEPLFTTRRNAFSGEEEGTGLGMWLVKSIIEENDGNIKLLYPEIGFGVRLSFPIKFKK